MIPYEGFKASLTESNSRGAHEADMKARHHESMAMYHHDMAAGYSHEGDREKVANHNEAANHHFQAHHHFYKAKRLYDSRNSAQASLNFEAGHHWAKAAEETEKRYGLNEEADHNLEMEKKSREVRKKWIDLRRLQNRTARSRGFKNFKEWQPDDRDPNQ